MKVRPMKMFMYGTLLAAAFNAGAAELPPVLNLGHPALGLESL